MIKIGSIVIHCYEFDRMIRFWKDALGYDFREEPSADWAVITDPAGKGPNMSFQKREHPRDRRSWLHIDLYAPERDAEVKRLLALGARDYPWRYEGGEDYRVLQDPDGNLFCVVQKG